MGTSYPSWPRIAGHEGRVESVARSFPPVGLPIARTSGARGSAASNHEKGRVAALPCACHLGRVGYDRSAMDKSGSRCCRLRTAILVGIPLLLLLSIAPSAQTPSQAATAQPEIEAPLKWPGQPSGADRCI